ncbi:hypothetical protein AX774_g5597 [Zancudomyces culisetae]|uniref:Uncharacterized protein n=1 Tax=Zancudomyces culisetae TaxID=1213189 RepID=A0A1R1PIY4_ZANCU|nr:hypothetical protein AX774_g5597 [Zancudomyces culisetae]|eukprot:OMH80944.1 hypothetical protein AX774_g5597 [Zancudomyces culisetae]
MEELSNAKSNFDDGKSANIVDSIEDFESFDDFGDFEDFQQFEPAVPPVEQSVPFSHEQANENDVLKRLDYILDPIVRNSNMSHIEYGEALSRCLELIFPKERYTEAASFNASAKGSSINQPEFGTASKDSGFETTSFELPKFAPGNEIPNESDIHSLLLFNLGIEKYIPDKIDSFNEKSDEYGGSADTLEAVGNDDSTPGCNDHKNKNDGGKGRNLVLDSDGNHLKYTKEGASSLARSGDKASEKPPLLSIQDIQNFVSKPDFDPINDGKTLDLALFSIKKYIKRAETEQKLLSEESEAYNQVIQGIIEQASRLKVVESKK